MIFGAIPSFIIAIAYASACAFVSYWGARQAHRAVAEIRRIAEQMHRLMSAYQSSQISLQVELEDLRDTLKDKKTLEMFP